MSIFRFAAVFVGISILLSAAGCYQPYSPALARPSLLALFPKGDRLAIFDKQNTRILITDLDFKLLKEIPTPDLTDAWGMNISSKNEIWLTNISSRGVQFTAEQKKKSAIAEVVIFSQDGDRIKKFVWEGEEGPVVAPAQVVPLDDGSFFLTDLRFNKVFRINDKKEVLYSFSEFGDDPGQTYCPQDIDVFPDGRILVVECFNSRVQVFDNHGKHLAFLALKGSEPGELLFPEYANLGSDGNIYVSEHGSMRVSVFSKDFQFIRCLEVPKVNGEPEFVELFDVTYVPEKKQVFVGDAINSLIHVFDEKGKWVKSVDRIH